MLTSHLEKDQRSARQLASVVLTLLIVLLTGLVALGELLFWLIWLVWGDAPGVSLLMGLSAVMLPYLLLICVAAQLTTMYYAAQHFTIPAFTPMVLNVVWLAAAWGVAPLYAPNQADQAYVLAVGVLAAGVLQVAVQLPMLRRLGFHFDFNWAAAREGLRQIARNLAPMFVGLAVTQINTFNDSLIAWVLTARPGGARVISWLGGIHYPMESGSVAALYYGERLYEFPLGLIGTAVAVVIFPLLSRHAVRGDLRRLGDDMTFGLRLVLCVSVPAGLGLILMAQPVARLLFEHGEFTANDTLRTAGTITCYATGIWAYCATQVLVRGFYALNDAVTPVRVAAGMVGLNLLLNFTLIWPMGEDGLATSTAIAAAVQVFVLMGLFSHRWASLDQKALRIMAVRTLAASIAMAAVVLLLLQYTPTGAALTSQLIRVAVPITLGGTAYCLVYRLLGGRELGMLFKGK